MNLLYQISVNSFLIFKCAKEAFNSNIKNNACLYIAITFLVVQTILLGFFAKSKSNYIEIQEKKEEDKKTKEKNKNKKKDKKKKRDIKTDKKRMKENKKESKANPPKVGNFSITDDLEEEGNSVFKKDKNDLEKGMQEKDKEKFPNNDSELSDKGKNISNNIQDKDSVISKDIKNENPEFIYKIRMKPINDFKKRKSMISSDNEEDEKEGEYSNTTKEMKKKGAKKKKEKEEKNKKIKLILLEQKDFHAEEGGVVIKDKQKKNNIKIRDILFSNKDSNTVSALNKKKEDTNQKTKSISFTEIIKNPSTPFAYYYWKLFQLKQPIVALFSPIKILNIEESYIPTLVKIMRIIFILSINIFFNILHLEQKYFRKKFEYFNDKYKLRYTFLEEKISSFELFSYGFSHAYVAAFISFLVCLILQ